LRVAFALAGLGGFNAHGAGFLAAASKWDLRPELVTATSGQILVLADWLRGDTDLRASLVSPARENNPLAQLQTALFGYPGVFRPAYQEAIARLTSVPDPREGLLDFFADRVLPAQQYVPARPDASFEDTAETLNASSIGVVFNSYDPKTGMGFLYGNEAARRALPTEKKIPNTHGAGMAQAPGPRDLRYVSHVSAERDIQPITADAIKSALWLSLYGFTNIPGGQMDGAYHRSCIISELHDFDRIFVARPLANGWYGKAPANWFEVQRPDRRGRHHGREIQEGRARRDRAGNPRRLFQLFHRAHRGLRQGPCTFGKGLCQPRPAEAFAISPGYLPTTTKTVIPTHAGRGGELSILIVST